MLLTLTDGLKGLLFLLIIHNCSGKLDNITNILETVSVNIKHMLQSRISSNCQNQSEELIQGVLHLDPWALRMLDASAKIPSGILDGNGLSMMGSYDECRSINVQLEDNATSSSISGKYCIIEIDIVIPHMDNISIVKSDSVIPLSVGICIPNGCTNEDAQSVLDAANFILPFLPRLKIQSCSDKKNSLNAATIAVFTLWATIAAILLLATAVDLAPQLQGWWIRIASQKHGSMDVLPNDSGSQTNVIRRFFVAISLYNNGKQLFSMNDSRDRLPFLNGLRFLSTAWIILLHVFLLPAVSTQFVDDYSILSTRTKSIWSLLYQQGVLPVSTFFFISGFLLSYTTLREARRIGTINPLKFYLHRYWRLLAPMTMTIAVAVVSVHTFHYGPNLSLMISQAEFCYKNWWQNILFINNYFPTERTCLGHTWYIAADFQLFVFSPLVLYPLYKKPKIGYCVMAILTIGSIIATGVVTYNARDMVTEQARTYFQTYVQIPTYVVGMLTGYILQRPNSEIRLKPVTVCCCWLFVTILNLSIVFGNYHGNDPITPNSFQVTTSEIFYNTFSRLAWALCLAWITIACSRGFGGIVNDILSWNFWTPLSRLTYCMYLLHLPVLVIFVSTRQSKFHLDQLFNTFFFLAVLTMSILVSVPFTLFFELPMVAIAKFKYITKNNEGNLKHLNMFRSNSHSDKKSDFIKSEHDKEGSNN